MGGGGVARARIDVDADFSKADAKLSKFGKTFGQTAKGVFVPTQVAAESAAKAVDKLAAAQQKLIAQHRALAAKKAAEIFTVPEKGAQEIARLTANLNRAERAFAGTGQQSQKLANYIEILRQKINAVRAAHGENILPVSQIQAAAKEINALRARLAELERAFKGKKLIPGSGEANEINKVKDAIEKLGGATDRNLNFIQRHSVAINQLAFSAARAGHGFANFLPLIARSSTLLANAGGAAGGASGAMTALKGAAAGAGVAISGAAIAATAGVAAFILLAVGIGVLTAKLGPLGSALIKAQDSIKLIFGSAGQDMLKFSRDAATAFGITEQAALRFVGKVGQLNKSFGIGAEGAGQMSKALLISADVLRSTSTEFIAADEALQAVFDTAAGNVEGLRRFDVFLSELGLTGFAVAQGLKVTTGAFDNVQRSLVSQLATIREAQARWDQYINTMDSTQRQAERTKAAFDSVKATLGTGFAPILAFTSSVLLGIVQTFKDIVNAIGDFNEDNKGLIESFEKIRNVLAKMYPALFLLSKVLGFFKDKGDAAAESALSLKERNDELEKGAQELIDTFNNYNRVLSVTDLEQLIDAHKRLADATADAGRAIKDAELDLSRAREDAVRKREDAERNLAEVIEDAVEKEFEARKKVKDVEKKNFRDIRDAERALKKERLESTKRVADAERALDEARKKRAAAILEALISIQDAQFKFDTQSFNRAQRELSKARDSTDVKNAQRKLEEEEIDRKKRIALLEEKLRETRLDAYEALKEAERELGNVIEENYENILEARRKLHEVEVETSRSLYDAQQALADARREGAESIAEAEQALERLNYQFGTADQTLAQILDKLEKMKNTIASMQPLPGTYGRSGDSGVSPGGFALGGSMFKGQLGLVGERGPELFIPNQNGQVISNDVLRKLIAAMNGGRGGGGGNSIVVHEAADPDATAFAVEARMMRDIQR